MSTELREAIELEHDYIDDEQSKINLFNGTVNTFALILLIAGGGVASLLLAKSAMSNTGVLQAVGAAVVTLIVVGLLVFAVPLFGKRWRKNILLSQRRLSERLANFAAETYQVKMDETAKSMLARDPQSSVAVMSKAGKRLVVRFLFEDDRISLVKQESEL